MHLFIHSFILCCFIHVFIYSCIYLYIYLHMNYLFIDSYVIFCPPIYFYHANKNVLSFVS